MTTGASTRPTEGFGALALTPTQGLISDVLAARWRLGEQVWTFSDRVLVSIKSLASMGLVEWKHSSAEHTVLVWMTDEGIKAFVSDDYIPPILRAQENRRLDEQHSSTGYRARYPYGL